ncbi:type IV secretion system DNA-binding domain-containing protein [Achromobacter xylosoxidans]|uniref:type IV secretion system DNA-binding domain-containing protein n=1 Tax=Alcaligenes xylosoxydans xylosoxydans TaxID=85698 RepID=UPI001F05D874|nr:type IV secretion system DNA-binding domain-containing protein [Achromobacter xylosoxidans]MCH1986473.1 type IV secretion system DNA-binding domain-containing protein [Achromobacter xylosoxidans]MCH1992275.1 type IV secretion system DNA-binding domain-containing protein [Achromobacter xylosoxidans]MCH4586594.1 type IV secretion system DNA-binding domain-containing protein [Achromobacter xylosoxidans]
MAPDIRRRIIKFAVLFFPVSAWLVTAKLMSDIPFNSITWRVLSLWVISTPHHTPLVVSLVAGFVLALVLAFSLKRYAKSEGFDGAGYVKHIRGTQVVPIKKLERMCTEKHGKDQVIVAGVPMPIDIENLHTLLNGATGSGKSVLLRDLVFSAQKRGDRMVIVDPDGDLYSRFGRPIDVLLNPYDERTQGWSFFNEVRGEYDWKRIALSIVPLGQDKNAEEWNGYARLLLRETARKLHELATPSVGELFRWTTIASDKDLRAFLTGTLAESLFAGSAEASKALTSSRFVLSKYLAEHVTMPAGRFSIRNWMEGDTGNLYIPWREDMKESMKPLVSTWVDIFCSALLSLPEDYYRRWWLVIDELASMEKLASIEDYLTKGRRKGGCCVAGLQTVSQLDEIFGEKMAQTLRASFRSLVVLGGSKTDPATAEEMSKALGEHEVARPEYTDSRNPGSSRSTSERLVRSTERVVTPAQIQVLPHLTGWLAFAGNRPISKFVLEPQTFAVRNAPFLEAKRGGAHSVVKAPAGGPSPWGQVDLPEDPTMAN